MPVRKSPLQHVSPRIGSLHNELLEHKANSGSDAPRCFTLRLFAVTRRRHPRPPRRRKGTCRGGSAGSDPATSPPSGWPAGGCGAASSSAWPPGRPPRSRSSPATPAAASPAAPRYRSLGRQNAGRTRFETSPATLNNPPVMLRSQAGGAGGLRKPNGRTCPFQPKSERFSKYYPPVLPF